MIKTTKTICFANNKGGSGKSTTCSNIGYALSQQGKKVLMIDGDMQLNLSLAFLSEEVVLDIAKSDKNLYVAVSKQQDLTDYIYETEYENLDIIPSSTLISGIEYELFTKWQREFIVKKCLQTIQASGIYDYILIDAPPTLGTWVINLLCASDEVIIPVEASPWGLFGLANMFEFLQAIREMAPNLMLLGIAMTKVNTNKKYFKQTQESLYLLEDTHVFENYIRIDSMIEWAQENSKPVGAYKKSARSAHEYAALAKEVDQYVHK